MNWQVNTYCWGRSVATQENLDPGEKRINRIYYIHSGEAYLELDSGRQRLLPGWLYALGGTIVALVIVLMGANARANRRKALEDDEMD